MRDSWTFGTEAQADKFIEFIQLRHRHEVALKSPRNPCEVVFSGEEMMKMAIAFYWGWQFALEAQSI